MAEFKHFLNIMLFSILLAVVVKYTGCLGEPRELTEEEYEELREREYDYGRGGR